MPALKSPEVHVLPRLSGLTTYHQEPFLDTDGLDTEQTTDLSGHFGSNPVINYASVTVPVYPGARMDEITLRLTLRDEWKGKGALLSAARKLGIVITHEACPYNGGSDTLVVKGPDNIIALGKQLRDAFETSTREPGATYQRPVIHPDLIGTLTDDVAKIVIANKTPGSDTWKQAFKDYGWRP